MEDNQKPIPKLGGESFGKYISAIYRHSQILVSARLKPFGIGSGQYIFLLTIFANEGISQKALSEQLAIDKATTAKAVGKLETLGYVVRKTSPFDNRYNLLYLTDSGKLIVPKVKKILNELTGLSLAEVSDEEYSLMMNTLQKLLFNIRGLVHTEVSDSR
jgi:DNA-binding MarR family transcriptional regulator